MTDDDALGFGEEQFASGNVVAGDGERDDVYEGPVRECTDDARAGAVDHGAEHDGVHV
jgi:hypothetical protein